MHSTFTSIFDQIVAGDIGLGFFGVSCAAFGVGFGLTAYGVSLVIGKDEAERKIGRSMLLSAGFQFAVLTVALMSGYWQLAGIGLLVAAYVLLMVRKKKVPIHAPEPTASGRGSS